MNSTTTKLTSHHLWQKRNQWLSNYSNQSGYEQLNLENGSSVNSDNFDAPDLGFNRLSQSLSPLGKNATVKEHTRRCNTVEKLLGILVRDNCKEAWGFLSDQQTSYNRILIFILSFSFFIFPGDIGDFLILFYLFRETYYPIPRGQRGVSSALQSKALFGGVPEFRFCDNAFYLFLFFSFQGDISNCWTPSVVLCLSLYFSTILFKSLRHVCIHLWSIYLQWFLSNSTTLRWNSRQFPCVLIVQNF